MSEDDNIPPVATNFSDLAEKIAASVSKAGVGRRSTITADKIRILLQVIAAGNFVEVACDYAGVPISTYYYWQKRGEAELRRLMELMEKGEADPQPLESEFVYLELLEAIKRVTAQGEVKAVLEINSAFRGDWRAALEFLKHRHRDRWHKKVELMGDPEAPLPVRLYLPDNKRGPKPTAVPTEEKPRATKVPGEAKG